MKVLNVKSKDRFGKIKEAMNVKIGRILRPPVFCLARHVKISQDNF